MTGSRPEGVIETVRAFNRFYTNAIGVLDEHLLGSPYTLTEVRVLFELAHHDHFTAAHLVGVLNLDPGYVSRILAKFRKDGLVDRMQDLNDRRRHVLFLTDRGEEVFADLNERSAEQAELMIRYLGLWERRQVADAMALIRRRLEDPIPRGAYLRRLEPGDLGWIVYSQGKGYAARYGWNAEYEALVARIAADFAAGHDPEREAGWIAHIEGVPVGSIVCVDAGDSVAKLRLLWVEPEARGLGIGNDLVRTCVAFARRTGYTSMTLWTVSLLDSARRIYQKAGFTLAKEEPPAPMFGQEGLSGQVWTLDLR